MISNSGSSSRSDHSGELGGLKATQRNDLIFGKEAAPMLHSSVAFVILAIRHSFSQSGVTPGTNELTAVGKMASQTKLNIFSDLSTRIAHQKMPELFVKYHPSEGVGTGIRRHLFSVEDGTAPRSLTLFSPSKTWGRDHEVLQANS